MFAWFNWMVAGWLLAKLHSRWHEARLPEIFLYYVAAFLNVVMAMVAERFR